MKHIAAKAYEMAMEINERVPGFTGATIKKFRESGASCREIVAVMDLFIDGLVASKMLSWPDDLSDEEERFLTVMIVAHLEYGGAFS